ncbi:hypothetical protein HanRHA438_Chr08g0356471 [Helianthus annuus]|uniref:6,7-dimethyl-8-ribityllumazine synthase n=1 Tax=Helianthus annuus TaxID=4232 RepID=A0A251U7V6_HELAN|nr:uncharacterized protein LOC110873215 [Helianthus annuus]KAF5795888.1 hypothetical protein HanXRQr2_Chr08g0344951 [Helianthus annuus]KAJ0539335.1 hypothetical protein HanHA300_Chr08g0285141 [Helianthus annuus]KAJ0547450.1 hypothetical protein HanIR_Chr08g0372321 [Helianthus annuus]KAJ0553998.1 hypothetical protein HanHA89_Chr08g0302651 [Helianthus annuus]KAJ0719632.1 hypothetical protein HanLR1_Chr08g0283911 [Helianthus annuus]
MGNSLRCCLACVLPCGALDLIRIVHLNGYVEEITRPVTAGEVLKNYPNHVLSKPCSQGVVRKILILSNSTELKRGSIYFLIPSSSVPENKRNPQQKDLKKVKKVVESNDVVVAVQSSDVVVVSEKKKGGHRRARRTVQASEWRPHLESIFEE